LIVNEYIFSQSVFTVPFLSKLFVDALYNLTYTFHISLVGVQLNITFKPFHVHDTFDDNISFDQELDVCDIGLSQLGQNSDVPILSAHP
jgi:hypothetical protein